MRPLSRGGAVRDAVAGVELAAMSIPQALGYATIAGMPAVTGFYTLVLPLIAFATFGSSSYLVVAADSATAAILAGGLSPLAAIASPEYVALAGTVALLTAGLLFLARLLKLGFLADFLSRTVLVGFLTGVGFQVGIAVLGDMLGIDVHSRRTAIRLVEIVRSLPSVHLPSLALAATVVGGVLLLDRFAKRVPGALIALVGAIAASAAFKFAGHGIGTIGPVAGGLPHFRWPDPSWKTIEPLVPLAVSCFVMIVAQSAATARVYSVRHHQRQDENADLVGLGAANVAAAISGTFVVNGSPTQTGMAERSGGQTQVTHVAAAAVVTLVLLFLTRPFQYLPRCVLAAIVFTVAIHLTDIRGLRRIREESPGEFVLAVTTALVVVVLGVEQGIILAMVLSLLRIVSHSYRPHTAILVQDNEGVWQSVPVDRGAMTQPGLLVYRFGAALFYANAGLFVDEVQRIAATTSGLRWLVIDAGTIPKVDYTAAQEVRELIRDLAKNGVTVVIAHVEPELQADLDRHHLTEVTGRAGIFDTLRDAIAGYHAFTG